MPIAFVRGVRAAHDGSLVSVEQTHRARILPILRLNRPDSVLPEHQHVDREGQGYGARGGGNGPEKGPPPGGEGER